MIRPGLMTILVAFLVITGCSKKSSESAEQSGLTGNLTLTGSSTIAPLVNEIAKRFESRNAGVRVNVQSGGSSRGIADVRRGTAEIGMVSRSLKSEETDLTAQTIAMDGVALIIHRDNPVATLTDEQVIGIYTGRITHWRDVGGRSDPITVVNKADGRSTLELFLSHYKLKAEAIRAGIVIGENLQGIRTVAGDPNAIGYVSIGTAESEASRGRPIKLLPMGGVQPTLANVRNKLFPLSRPLNLVTHGEVPPLAAAFIAFARSNQVNDLVEGQFFVPISE